MPAQVRGLGKVNSSAVRELSWTDAAYWEGKPLPDVERWCSVDALPPVNNSDVGVSDRYCGQLRASTEE